MALAYLTLGERRFYTSSGTWPAMRFETMSVPNTTNRFLAHADFPRHGTRAPMRRMGRMFGRRLCHNALHKLCADFRRAARPRRITFDPRNPARSKTVTPACDRARHDVQLRRDLLILQSPRREQDDACSLRDTNRNATSLRPASQPFAKFRGQRNGRRDTQFYFSGAF